MRAMKDYITVNGSEVKNTITVMGSHSNRRIWSFKIVVLTSRRRLCFSSLMKKSYSTHVISIFLDVLGLRINDLQFIILNPYPSHSYPLMLSELINTASWPGLVAVTVFITDKDGTDLARGAASDKTTKRGNMNNALKVCFQHGVQWGGGRLGASLC